MGFSDFASSSPHQFKSVSLRTNEEFVRWYNDLEETVNLYFDTPHPRRFLLWRYYIEWELFEEEMQHVQHLLMKVEKCSQLSEALPGIRLQFEQQVVPTLKRYHLSLDDAQSTLSDFSTALHDPAQLLRGFLEVFADSVSLEVEAAHKVVVSALALLSFVYQYLVGCVDKRGSKTYSPGSFLFRLIFVAIVLFLGSYVWIKFRQASFTANRRKRKSGPLADPTSQLGDESDVPGGVYRREVKDSKGSVTHYRYEPRFKPRRENPESGTPLKFNHLSLGSYKTPREAEIVRHIAAVFYGKEEGRPVQFEDGFCLPFPSVTEPEKCPSSGKEKADWVAHKTKELYAELLEEKKRREKLVPQALETGSNAGHDVEARRSDPSPSASVAPSTAFELTCFTPPHGGNVVGDRANSESHGLGQEPLLARDLFSAFFPDFVFDQVISSLPDGEENDFPAMDDPEQTAGDYLETDCVFGFESTSVPPQSSAVDNPTTEIFASLTALGVGDQGLGITEAQLNSATAITFQQLESLPEQVQLQQHVIHQEQRAEEFLGSNVELQQRLLESEKRNSELQQKLRKAEVEMEKWRSTCRQWRSMFRQLAKLVSASDGDGSPVDIP